VSAISGVAGLAFALLGAAAERLAAYWPPDEASRRGPSLRTMLLALLAGMAAAAVVARSGLPAWATAGYLALLAPMVVLTATDLEQRRLPHVVLDPTIVAAAAFVPLNPALGPDLGARVVNAAIGAAVAVAFLGLTGLVVRGGIALGDIYLVAPIGLMLGWPAVFTAVFIGAILSAVAGLALLASRRAGLRTYIPFGPFLVAGLVLALVTDPRRLGVPAP
jgi:leader peptidase (prepilin peptidase)/N-methyltransferase